MNIPYTYVSEPMTMEKMPGIFVFLMKNTNNMELDKKLVDRMTASKIGYLLGKEYLMTKRENLNGAIRELKRWHMI
jgi:hypothetical protein